MAKFTMILFSVFSDGGSTLARNGSPVETGELVYLLRAASGNWERLDAQAATVRGELPPFHAPYLPWARALPALRPVPTLAAGHRSRGILYLTNWRLVFKDTDQTFAAFFLRDIGGVECFRDGVALTVAGQQARFVLAVHSPVSVGLYLARAIRTATTG